MPRRALGRRAFCGARPPGRGTICRRRSTPRAIGKPRTDASYPPLRIELGAGTMFADVTPNAKGAPATLGSAGALQSGTTRLVLTSHAPATFALKDIDV